MLSQRGPDCRSFFTGGCYATDCTIAVGTRALDQDVLWRARSMKTTRLASFPLQHIKTVLTSSLEISQGFLKFLAKQWTLDIRWFKMQKPCLGKCWLPKQGQMWQPSHLLFLTRVYGSPVSNFLGWSDIECSALRHQEVDDGYWRPVYEPTPSCLGACSPRPPKGCHLRIKLKLSESLALNRAYIYFFGFFWNDASL